MRLAVVLICACSSQPQSPAAPPATTGAAIGGSIEPAIEAARVVGPSPSAVVQLAIGRSHTCARHEDLTVSCWGSNDVNQLGVERAKLERSLVPLAVPGVVGAIELAATENQTCIRRADNTVHCWGHIGVNSDVASPTQITESVVQMAGRCFLSKAGTVECLTERAQLVQVDALEKVVQIASDSADRGCGVHEDGNVTCWVADKRHKIKSVKDAVEVVDSRNGMCARQRDGDVKCWIIIDLNTLTEGSPAFKNARGLIGGMSVCARTDDNIECWDDRGEKKKLDVPPSSAMAIGAQHRCWTKGKSREVMCMGNGLEGELGNGWWRRRPIPTRVAGVENAVEISGALRKMATCVRSKDNVVSCWGPYPSAAHADPKKIEIANPRQLISSDTLRVLDDKGVLHEADYRSTWSEYNSFAVKEKNVATATENCFVSTKGRARCWRSYMEVDPKDERYALTPKIEDAVEIRSFNEQGNTCVRRKTGQVSCFRQGATQITDTEITDAIALEVIENAQCAIRADHSLWCWGSTQSQIFSQRPVPNDVLPTKVPIGPVVALSMIRDTICVVKESGAVACWGANVEGQLGDGTFLPRDRPSDVIGIEDAVDVHVGWGFACALHRSGRVSCWGATENGQVGTYAMSDVKTPTNVAWPSQ